MTAIDQVYKKIGEDMEKIEESETKKDYDSALTILKDQITFVDGYLTEEKNATEANILYGILRDRKLLVRTLKIAKQLDALEKSTDDRIVNLVHQVTKIEREMQIKKEGK